ncbi:MAG TPA: glycosyltransferase [Bryobacteraceae bacterium]|jgi:spore maturation protein CgeB|nr:glycosyltransferase [Bryobacteraceae bacterium]
MKIVMLGLCVTSSWGNGHATTYRSLIKGLAARGHEVLFLERDVPWYAQNRDQPQPAGARTELYEDLGQLFERYEADVRNADLTIVGSYVPEGVAVGEWVTATARGVRAFYDIDTPVTLEKLASRDREYITPELVRRYHLYLSFAGGRTLKIIERRWGSPMARVLYCSVDTTLYRPCFQQPRWDLGYLGTWSQDRQVWLEELLCKPARRWPEGRFSVVGPLYPDGIEWPRNVERITHLSPQQHARFYGSQRFTLNITRDAMKRAGYSPSVRLFEAGACGVPIISDWWPGLDTIFTPGREILLSSNADDTLRLVRDFSAQDLRRIGEAAMRRVHAEHTPAMRALQLEQYYEEASSALEKAMSA